MLVIRARQREVFREMMRKHLASRLTVYLRTHHREACEGRAPGALAQLVDTGIQRAMSYGLTWESSLGWFIATMLEVSPNFDQHPRIRKRLLSPEFQERRKIERLLLETSERTWNEAEEIS